MKLFSADLDRPSAVLSGAFRALPAARATEGMYARGHVPVKSQNTTSSGISERATTISRQTVVVGRAAARQPAAGRGPAERRLVGASNTLRGRSRGHHSAAPRRLVDASRTERPCYYLTPLKAAPHASRRAAASGHFSGLRMVAVLKGIAPARGWCVGPLGKGVARRSADSPDSVLSWVATGSRTGSWRLSRAGWRALGLLSGCRVDA